MLAKAGKRARPLQGADAGGGRSEFGRSTAVFARLQEQQDQAKAGELLFCKHPFAHLTLHGDKR